jgi:hypothetical protein
MAEAPITLKIESEPLRKYLRGVPAYVSRGMAAAAVRAGQRFLTYHRRLRLSAKTVAEQGPLVGTGKPSNKETREPGQGFVGRRFFYVTGDSVENSTLSIRALGGPLKAHELGLTLTAKGEFPVPLPAAKDSRGRVAGWAKRLLKTRRTTVRTWRRHRGLALSAGMDLGGRQLVVFTARNGKRYLATVNGLAKGRERIKLLFHLQKTVRQRPRLEFISTWRSFEKKAAAIYRQALPYAIRAAAKKQGINSIALPEGLGNA